MERKIKIFSFAAILMLAVSVIGCKHNVNNRPETFTVTFSVEGENGSLKAKADGITETDKSPITVEKDKTVTFTAVPTAGYRVKGWTLDGVAVNGANTSYALKVSKSVNVKVSFEKLPPGSFAVTFSVDGAGGTLKATVEDGSEITSGKTIEHGKTVTFTAGPSDNYEVDKWTITGGAFETGTGIGGSTTAKVKITATVNITVSFKLKNYTVTFSVDGAGGTLKATADGVAETETSPITVEHGKTVAFTAAPAAGYRVKGWTLDGTAIAKAGTNTEYTLTVTKPATITVSFEPKKALLTLAAGKNTVKVKAKTADGSAIKVEGCSVNELANEAETTLTVTDSERKLALIGDIIELDCSGEETPGGNRPLIALDISGCTALQKLNCQYNKITELDVQGLNALQELYCNSNTLTVLDVHGLTKLEKLDCNVNGLTALNAQGLTALQELICNDNKILELNVQGLTSLQKLECYNNQLKTLNVQGLTELQELNCRNNQLATLNVQGLTALQKLDCRKNQLSALDVQGCTALKRLVCFQNKLNADAFTKLFNDLPTREISDEAKALLYKERTANEENCTNLTQPESLKKAFEDAKNIKHWKLQKADGFGFGTDI